MSRLDVLGSLVEGRPWGRSAACLDTDPDLFFPAGTGKEFAPQIAKAKAVCRRCPVTAECLRWALDHRERHGVWGGVDETERQQLRQPRLHPVTAARPEVVSEEYCQECLAPLPEYHGLPQRRPRYCPGRDCKRLAGNRREQARKEARAKAVAS